MNRIGDYALIGDCHSLALVGRDGSIDWACFPRFDSPSLFAKLLDADRGGHFLLAPADPDPSATRRRYLEDTNVVVTTFETESGTLEVTDCMPVSSAEPDGATGVEADHAVLRRARCTGGTVEVLLEVAPRFEYATFVPRFVPVSATAGEVVGGSDALFVECTRPITTDGVSFSGRYRLAAGEEVWAAACWYPSLRSSGGRSPIPARSFAARLETTVAFWRKWMANCTYEGEHEGPVRRSALVLKALTYAPSGAVVAAGTTSLPEQIGGSRNWDYRYTWIRDATLTFIALFTLGFFDEAAAFKRWLERASAGRPKDLQIMYGICGERRLPELELAHLAGHRGSGPVRIGNGAAGQTQLDSFGQILQAAHLFGAAGGSITTDNWAFLEGLADATVVRWVDADHGIWEMRDTPRHFSHSKAHCWMALDRAVRLGERRGGKDLSTWVAERDRISAYLLADAGEAGFIPQAAGVRAADASALMVPAIGLLPTAHPLVEATIDRVRGELEVDGLVYRYLAGDGLAGGEGAFLLCSFWLLDCLIHANRLDEAGELLERLLGLANDLGLYSEEVDVTTGEALGNFPQAFTHMALVTSCSHLDAARRGEVPFEGAFDYAELALERLLRRRGPIAGTA